MQGWGPSGGRVAFGAAEVREVGRRGRTTHHALGRFHDPDRNLTAVGDQQLGNTAGLGRLGSHAAGTDGPVEDGEMESGDGQPPHP